MPRDSNGNYTLPLQPVVTGGVVSSSWANTTLNDLANEMTGSLNRSGEGGMLSAFKLLDGTVTAPGLAWTNEPTTGFFRAAANTIGISIAGVLRATMTTQTLGLGSLQVVSTGTPAVGGASLVMGAPLVNMGLSAMSHTGGALSAVLAASPGGAASYRLHMGLNLWWGGSNWVTGTDGGSNGGAMVASAYNPGDLGFYTVANIGTAQQSISNTNIANNLRLYISSTGNQTMYAPTSGTTLAVNMAPGATGALYVQSSNTSYTSPQLLLSSTSAVGFASMEYWIQGTLQARIRSDYTGELVYATTGSGGHSWYITGDYGTGEVALALSPTGQLTISPPLSAQAALYVNAISGTHSTVIEDSAGNAYNAGYLGAPYTTFAGTTYTALLSDRGKTLSPAYAGASTLTINPLLYAAGDILIVENFSGGNLTITVSSGNLYWIGTGGTGNRTLAYAGRCTLCIRQSNAVTIAGINLT